MAAVGLPIWTPGVWADTLWAAGVWRDDTTPPPPPPVVESEDLSGGWLAQVARWQAPPWRQARDDDEATTGPQDSQPAGLEPAPLSSRDAAADGPAHSPVPRRALLATAHALPPLDWAPVQALAAADLRRRHALAQAGEEEELLVLLLLLEVL